MFNTGKPERKRQNVCLQRRKHELTSASTLPAHAGRRRRSNRLACCRAEKLSSSLQGNVAGAVRVALYLG